MVDKKTLEFLKDYYEKNMSDALAWLNGYAHTFAV